ncbi:LysE family translocator [Yoonia sediminilitoris]|uniref:Threonine/homoserine/homoserine lactone efflux protein n=1 Tax=Yoonia sediminilitoris TaxID=1286148 RepID=A0A2T6KLQ7_9RHOB|nr:LysE family translocator [Yoonia sediminilitoris]PUB17155.1 threonine/homoserine/homoserine lactone efflux protein [Yoonia sediminilitoris]RCW97450.1 threonine/homoserine/homoserine lactone efflux protein [Yoonia sediminilitoris]
MAEFLPLMGFVFFGLFSPGPNVILLTASGARFGVQRTIPHILGVAIGVGITSAFTGFGVGVLLNTHPTLKLGLQIGASLWILWMAYKLWFASPKQPSANDRPFTFIEAVLFQWVNPKVWAVALSAMAYLPAMSAMQQAGVLAATFSGLNLGVCIFWTCAGTLLAYLLKNPRAWRVFMRIMAFALVVFSALIFI